MKSQEENIRSAISGLKLLLQVYEKKATPRAPYRAMRYSLSAGIEALEKQMPMKPKSQERGVYDDDSGDWICDEEWNMCPSCTIRHEVYPSWKFCHYCGQRLDWGE